MSQCSHCHTPLMSPQEEIERLQDLATELSSDADWRERALERMRRLRSLPLSPESPGLCHVCKALVETVLNKPYWVSAQVSWKRMRRRTLGD